MGETSFQSCNFKEDTLFDDAKFNCSLNLALTKYDKLYIRWRDIKDLYYEIVR